MIEYLVIWMATWGAACLALGLGHLLLTTWRGRRGSGTVGASVDHSPAALPTAPPPLSLSPAERRRYQHTAAMARCARDVEVSADLERQAAEYLATVWPDKADELLGHRGSRA